MTQTFWLNRVCNSAACCIVSSAREETNANAAADHAPPAPKAADHPTGSPGHRAPEDRSPKHAGVPSGQKSPKQEATHSSPPSTRTFPFSPETLCCLIFLLITAIFTVVFATVYFLSASKNSTAAALRAAPEFADACADGDALAECRNITLYMLDAMNPNALPCVDFYESVCGWWRANNPYRKPFLEEHVMNFNRRVGNALASKATIYSDNSSRADSLEAQMALFYTSCFRAFTGQSETSDAVAILQSMGSDALKWTNVSSFAGLLHLAVSTTLRSGLPSFLRVELAGNRTFRLDVGQSLASTFSRHSQKVRMFVERALHDLGVQLSPAWINSSKLFDIDRVVGEARSKATDQKWSLLKGPEELSYIASEIDWRDALERGLPARFRSDVQLQMRVQIRSEESMRNIVVHLRKLPPRQASTYTLLVLLAQVMKYAPYLEEQATSSVSGASVSSCLRLTAAHFGQLYPTWVARTFQDKDEVTVVRQLFEDIASTLRNDSRVNAGVLIDTRRITNARLVVYDETASASMPTAPLTANLGPDFLLNIAAIASARVGEEQEMIPDDYWLPQLRGHIGYGASANMLVSSTYLSRPSLFAQVSLGHKIQTPTLGALILRSIFDSDATYFPSWARHYIDGCFAASASSALGRHVEPTRAKRFMRSRWSAQLAWLLKSRRLAEEPSHREQAASAAVRRGKKDAAADRKVSLDRLFFRLLCFVECGEPDGKDLCNDMARCDRRFSRAFQCGGSSTKWPGSCDCYGMNHCETHFPGSWPSHPGAV